jgi:hypothetical protein
LFFKGLWYNPHVCQESDNRIIIQNYKPKEVRESPRQRRPEDRLRKRCGGRRGGEAGGTLIWRNNYSSKSICYAPGKQVKKHTASSPAVLQRLPRVLTNNLSRFQSLKLSILDNPC